MLRRKFITLLGGVAAWPFAAISQEAGRTYRIGGLSVSPRDASFFVPMVEYLREHGFIEGQNLTVDWHDYGTRIDLIPKFAEELVEAHVDVIYAAGAVAIRAAQQATTTIPIVGITDDMVASGLVSSLARPGGNTTGVSVLAPELNGKRQEILVEALPGLRRMGALADANAASQLQELQDAARERDIALSIYRIAQPEEISAAIDTAKASSAEALIVLSSPVLNGARRIIMERVAALGLPTIYQFPEEAEEGGLIAYGPRLVHIYRELIAPQLVKLLRGSKPADLPVEQPTKFELVVNLKTAKQLGLTLPEAFLARADEIIE